MRPHVDLADLGRRLGLRKRRRSWSGSCPACCYPSAFSMKAGKQGGVRAFCAAGCTADVLDDALTRALGADWKPPARLSEADMATQRAGKQAAAARLFAGSTRTLASDPFGCYLTRRGLSSFVGRPTLRYRGDCPHPEGGRLPAMVAEVLDVTGKPVACHRTYLTRDGGKAGVDPVKASLGPVWGGAVRLNPAAPELVIGEGIETAASAGLLLHLPAWAAISAGNLARGLMLPPEVRAVVIAADPDQAGIAAATAASTRWQAEGRRVRTAKPDVPGRDFNDILQERARRMAEVAHG